MKKILSSPIFYPLILVLLCLFIAYKNYTPNTFLSGWDTLHPEFNFPLNFQRLIFGVWRSDQGLGDVSGHSAMADLPRVFILWLFHFVLPLNFLRYSYIFLCLITGPLSFYFLLKYLYQKSKFSSLIAFLASLFYLFNLGTLQQFYVPFEMFPTQWAFLPLLILFSLKYLHSQKTTYLLIYLLLVFFSSPQAYAAQLWYAFFIVYFLFLLIFSLLYKNKFRLSLNLLLITLIASSFWLLPNIYYGLTSTKNPLTSKNNRLYSQEYLLQNRVTGTLENTSLIKGFYFNWNEYNFQRKSSDELTENWNQHLKNWDILLIGNLLFILSFTGLIAALFQKNKLFLAFSPFFIIPFFLLSNSTPLIRIPFDLLLKINLFQELFRFIFTKVSILFTFGVTLYLASTLHLVFSFLSEKFIKIFTLIFIFSLIVYCFPYFKGQLISPIVRINIPQNYFELHEYLRSSPDGRILTLPLHEFSGWQYYDWHYQGSGFIWFGFPQSILDRDSDRWEIRNEESYREFYYPLYAKNQERFLASLYKYNVHYLLWDQSVIPASPKNRDQITFKYETQKIIDNLITQNKISLLKQFDSLYLYQINQDTNLVKLQQINNFVSPSYQKNYWDSQYRTADYLNTNTALDTNYPLRDLLNSNETIKSNLIASLNPIPNLNYGGSYLFSLNSSNPNLKLIDGSLQINASNSSVQGIELDLPLSHEKAYVLSLETKYLNGLPLRFCLRNSYTFLCTLEDQVGKNTQLTTYNYLIPPMDEFENYTLSLNGLSFGSFSSISQIKSISVYSINSDLFLPTTNLENQSFPLNYQIIFPNYSLIKIKLPNTIVPRQYLSLYQSYSPAWLAFYFDDYHRLKFLPHLEINNWANGWEIPGDINNTEQIAPLSDGTEQIAPLSDGTEQIAPLSDGTEQSRLFPTTIYILFWPQILQFFGFGLLIGTIIWIYFVRNGRDHSLPSSDSR